MNIQHIVITTTFSNKNEAENCISILLDSHLAACCQFCEIESMYRWNGKIEKSKEYKVEIKTSKKCLHKIKETIIKNHSYEVPEIIAYAIIDGNEQYLQWIDDEVQ